jgi:GNAT superfamily N-acetyltransferase
MAFVLLDIKQHDVKSFDCGKPEMNLFLSRYADRNRKLGISSSWVLPINQSQNTLEKATIKSYYTLAYSTATRETIPTNQNLPAYPVPIILLARLAVNRDYQGQNLGKKTLVNALRQCVVLTDKSLPVLGVVLDVLDDNALSFYQKFNLFQPFTNNPMRLFVPMNVLRQI